MYQKHEMDTIAFDSEDVFADWGNTTISGSETPGYDEESIKTPTSDV